jgi:hypothetical protein
MRNPKTPPGLTAAALTLAVALAAAPSASADIVNSSGTYLGPIEGAGPASFETSSITVNCPDSGIGGTLDGDWTAGGPASALLDFSWGGCTTEPSSVPCTLDDLIGVDFEITEENAPDATFANTASAGVGMVCGTIFQCDWSWDADPGELSGEYDSATAILSFDVITDVLGPVGCPGEGRFRADYWIGTPEDNLFATGSQ